MLSVKLLFNVTRSHSRTVIHPLTRKSHQNVPLYSISKRFSHSTNDNEETILSLNEILQLSPLDVEKELHKSRRKLARLFKVANYPAALECAQDMELKVTTIMGKKNVSILEISIFNVTDYD